MAGNDDERPRRSWSEIDKRRDGSAQRRQEGGGGRQERLESSSAYRNYKTQLNKMFDGGSVPEALKSKLAEAGVKPSGTTKNAMAANIMAQTAQKDVLQALDAYRQAHGFPEHEDVLGKLLELDDEEIVHEAINTVGALCEQGVLKRGGSLKARIKAAQMTVDTAAVQQAAKAALRKL